jgi:hypothetical protein
MISFYDKMSQVVHSEAMKINIKIVQGKNEIYIEGNDTEEILDNLDDIKKITERIGNMPLLPLSLGQNDQVSQILTQDTSPSEIIAQVKPKNISDKIILMVYYLLKHGTSTVNVKDMKEIFNQILEDSPKNWGVMMNNLVGGKGLLMKATTKKDNIRTWSITRTGIEYVEQQLLKKGGS